MKLTKNLEFVRFVNSIKIENHCYNSNIDNKKLENNTWNFPKVSPKDGNLIGSVADQLNLNFHSSFACFTIVADPKHDEFAKGRNVTVLYAISNGENITYAHFLYSPLY